MSPSIVLGVTSDRSLKLFYGFPSFLASRGWEVHVVCAPGEALQRDSQLFPDVQFHPIAMERTPSLFKDIGSLYQWLQLLHRLRPAVVSVGTPKAGLLGTLAAWLLRTPLRVYVLRGLRHEGMRGVPRWGVKMSERLASFAAHRVLAVSHSLRRLAIRERLAPSARVLVLGAGSSNGVDDERFTCSPDERQAAKHARWPDEPDLPVIGFVGRLHRDKGVDLLADAASLLSANGYRARLLIVGGPDGDGAGKSWLERKLELCGFPVDFTGQVDDTAAYYKIMDVLCLPTRREGFPNVVLEAAAASIPTVATIATGVEDAILDGETGLICRTRDPADLAQALARTLRYEEERRTLGEAARQRVLANFSQHAVWTRHAAFYAQALEGSTRTGRRSRDD